MANSSTTMPALQTSTVPKKYISLGRLGPGVRPGHNGVKPFIQSLAPEGVVLTQGALRRHVVRRAHEAASHTGRRIEVLKRHFPCDFRTMPTSRHRRSFEMPKSVSFTWPMPFTSTFSGFTSRCSKRRRCRCSSPRITWDAMQASRSGLRPTIASLPVKNQSKGNSTCLYRGRQRWQLE